MTEQQQEWKSHYEAARWELKRAEELLKQRHENTRKILEKQKELRDELEKEKDLRRKAEGETKKYVRENQNLVKKVALLEKRILSLEQGATRAVPPAKRHASSPASRTIQKSIQNGKKGARLDIRGHEVVGPLQPDGTLRDMLTCLANDKKGSITNDTINEVAVCMIQSLASNSSWDQKDIVSVAYDVLVQCCCLGESYAPRLAPIEWAPCHWFPDTSGKARKKIRYHGIENPDRVKSLVTAWCDMTVLENDTIPWLLKCLCVLDQEASLHGCNVTKGLILRAYDATLENIDNDSTLSISRLCCSATITMALLRYTNDLQFAAIFIRDILSPLCATYPISTTQEQMILIALAAALEVWPLAMDRRAIGKDEESCLETLLNTYMVPPPDPNAIPGLAMMCHYASLFITALRDPCFT